MVAEGRELTAGGITRQENARISTHESLRGHRTSEALPKPFLLSLAAVATSEPMQYSCRSPIRVHEWSPGPTRQIPGLRAGSCSSQSGAASDTGTRQPDGSVHARLQPPPPSSLHRAVLSRSDGIRATGPPASPPRPPPGRDSTNRHGVLQGESRSLHRISRRILRRPEASSYAFLAPTADLTC